MMVKFLALVALLGGAIANPAAVEGRAPTDQHHHQHQHHDEHHHAKKDWVEEKKHGWLEEKRPCPYKLDVCSHHSDNLVVVNTHVPRCDAESVCHSLGMHLANIDDQNFSEATNVAFKCAGPNRSSWVGSWNGDEYHGACLALYTGSAAPGGSINVPECCTTKMPVICQKTPCYRKVEPGHKHWEPKCCGLDCPKEHQRIGWEKKDCDEPKKCEHKKWEHKKGDHKKRDPKKKRHETKKCERKHSKSSESSESTTSSSSESRSRSSSCDKRRHSRHRQSTQRGGNWIQPAEGNTNQRMGRNLSGENHRSESNNRSRSHGRSRSSDPRPCHHKKCHHKKCHQKKCCCPHRRRRSHGRQQAH